MTVNERKRRLNFPKLSSISLLVTSTVRSRLLQDCYEAKIICTSEKSIDVGVYIMYILHGLLYNYC